MTQAHTVPEIDKTEAVRQAAAESLERLRQDQRKATPALAAALGQLAEGAFTLTFRLKDLALSCGHGERWLWRRFKAELACTPKSYLERLRLETAQRLLENEEPPVYRVAEWVGYRSTETFSLAFTAWAKETPRAYRRRRLAEERSAAAARAAATGEPTTPAPPTTAESHAYIPADAELEKQVLQVLAPRLLSWSSEERRALATHGYEMSPDVIFQALLEEAREGCRDDPELGLELVDDALDILEDLREEISPAELAQLDAQAMTCLRLQERRRRALAAACA